jgi:hypothetical protein
VDQDGRFGSPQDDAALLLLSVAVAATPSFFRELPTTPAPR